MAENKTFRIRLGLVLVLSLLAAVVAVVMSRTRSAGELPFYMRAAEHLVQGEQIYRTNEPQAFTYPPFFALPNVLLVRLSPSARSVVWWFVNLELLMAVLWIVLGLAGPTIRRMGTLTGTPMWVAILMIAILSGRFLLSTLEYQSHDLIVLLLVLLAGLAMAGNRDVAAGVCGGLAAACKATPLLLLLVLCWQRRFRAATAFVAALLLATCLPDLFFPSRDGRLWVWHWYSTFVSKVSVGVAANAPGAWCSWNPLNQSLSGTLYRLCTPVKTDGSIVNVCLWHLEGMSLRAVTIILELAILGWLAWTTRRRQPLGTDRDPRFFALGQISAILCGMLLLSPMSSSQHFCMLVAPITVCVVYWLYGGRDRAVGAALLVVFVCGTLTARDLTGRLLGDWCQAVGCKTLCTLALLLATGRVLLAENREDSP